MSWDEECQLHIDKTLAEHAHREVLYTTITKLIDAKIHARLFAMGLDGASFDPNQNVDYLERLLAAVVDELHKDKP